jgi:hypothetical protein
MGSNSRAGVQLGNVHISLVEPLSASSPFYAVSALDLLSASLAQMH